MRGPTAAIDPVLAWVRSQDRKILELDCGFGGRAERLRDDDPGRVLWGVGGDPFSCRIARPKFDVLIDDPLDLAAGLPPGYFDSVILGAQVAKSPSLLLALRQCLAPSGRLIAQIRDLTDPANLSAIRSGALPPVCGAPPQWDLLSDLASFTTLTQFRAYLTEARFRLVSETAADHPGEFLVVAEPLSPIIDATAGVLGPPELAGSSVVVVTYNSAGTIVDCLASVRATLGADDELIVVDNGSADDTPKLLQAEAPGPNFRAILSEQNLGFSGGSNLGIRESRRSRICLLNPDTEVYPGWLRGLGSRLADESVGMVGPVTDYVMGRQFLGRWLAGNFDRPLSGRELAEVCARAFSGLAVYSRLLVGFCAMLRRETLNRVGLLDEGLFLGGDDLELSWRLWTHGLRLAIAPDVFVHHEGRRSFQTEKPEHVAQLLAESSERLVAKVTSVHGWRPPDRLLWGLDIVGC